jgi:ethanolamine utilization protein EutQ
MNIHVMDVITAAHGSPMAAGFMTWGKGSFPWTLNYDEVDFVIDGQLEIRLENQVVLGNPGDVIYIPKGSHIFFGSPTYAKIFYVTFPADWESQK